MGLFGMGKNKTKSAAPLRSVTLADGASYQLANSLDCIGDSCPRPQLMTKKALSAAVTGAVIEVLVDNPSSVEAIPPMLDDLDASHLETIKEDRCWKIYVRKD